MKKILAIAWKELYTTFTDRTLIIIMILTPLAISVIVGLAFGGLGGGDVPVRDIPVAIINQDTGSPFGVNYGQIIVSAFVPAAAAAADSLADAPVCDLAPADNGSDPAFNTSLDDLTDAALFDAAAAQALAARADFTMPQVAPEEAGYLEAVGRAAVDAGIYSALIVIPPDFSQNISYAPLHPQIEQTAVRVYANGGRPVSAGIIRSIVEGITNQIATGNIAIAATFGALQAQFGLASVGQTATTLDMESAFACAFTPALNLVGLDRQFIEGQQTNTTAAILVSVGAAQAMFFALFTSQFGVFSMYDERRNWTLQRLIVSPTPRAMILGGKLIGVALTVVFQLLALLVALTLVGSALSGGLTLIWGQNVLLIALTLIAVAVAVSGFGMLLAGVARTPEQGQTFGSVLNIALALLGGSFGVQLPTVVAQFSMIYWGRTAFESLASGQTDIGLHLVVLVVQGVVMFGIGLYLFNRRFDI